MCACVCVHVHVCVCVCVCVLCAVSADQRLPPVSHFFSELQPVMEARAVFAAECSLDPAAGQEGDGHLRQGSSGVRGAVRSDAAQEVQGAAGPVLPFGCRDTLSPFLWTTQLLIKIEGARSRLTASPTAKVRQIRRGGARRR